jgi:hypothetical protein
VNYYFVLLEIRDKSRDGRGGWRKPVGVEPTNDTRYRSPGLKPGPNTGQDWLPSAIVAGASSPCGFARGYERNTTKFPHNLILVL